MLKLPLFGMILILSGCTANSVDLQNQNLALIDSELTVLDLYNQDLRNARLHLAAAEALAPENPQILVTEGYFDQQVGDVKDAKQAYLAAIQAAPHDPDIENAYGVFLYQQGEYQQALAYFLAASQNPQNAIVGEALNNASLTELKLDDPKLAQSDFVQAQQEGFVAK